MEKVVFCLYIYANIVYHLLQSHQMFDSVGEFLSVLGNHV